MKPHSPTLLFGAAALLAGCANARYFLESNLPPVQASEIHPPDSPQPVELVLRFSHGWQYAMHCGRVEWETIAETIRETHLFSEVRHGHADGLGRLEFMVDQDFQEYSLPSWLLSVATIGVIGTRNQCSYVFHATWSAPGSSPVEREFGFTIHRTKGNHAQPRQTVELQEGGEVVRQVVLLALRDLQGEIYGHD